MKAQVQRERSPGAVYALIPARGGSKAIDRKNLCRVGGLPLVVRTIRDALDLPGIDRVYVTTDDPEIARVAVLEGAEVIRRPESLAGDAASTESAVSHAFEYWQAEPMGAPDIVVLLQCTSPFRGRQQLGAALETFLDGNGDSLLSVVRKHTFHWGESPDGGVLPLDYEPTRRPRRQDYRGRLEETGSFYIFSREMFEVEGSRLGGGMRAFEVPAADAIEIDEPHDLAWARAGWQARREAPACLSGGDPWLLIDLDAIDLENPGLGITVDCIIDEAARLALDVWREEGGKVAFCSKGPRLAHELAADSFVPDRWLVAYESADELLAGLGLHPRQVAWPGETETVLGPVYGLSAGPLAIELSSRSDHVTIVGAPTPEGDDVLLAQGLHVHVQQWVESLLEMRSKRSEVAGAQEAPAVPAELPRAA